MSVVNEAMISAAVTVLALLMLAWVTVLPSIGLLWLLGWV